MIVVSACRRILVKTIQARVCRVRGVGVREKRHDPERISHYQKEVAARKDVGGENDEKRIEDDYGKVEQKRQREGQKRDNKRGSRTAAGDFGGCGRL